MLGIDSPPVMPLDVEIERPISGHGFVRWKTMRYRVLVIGGFAGVAFSAVACGENVPSGYLQVAVDYGLPPAVFYAIAQTESRYRLANGDSRPWPWTLNIHGQAKRYPTRRDAFRALQYHLAQGRNSIDIGLMQVNWRYHHRALGTPWRALDPHHNLRVAAGILQNHYRAYRNWWLTVGAYHSPGRTQAQRARAERYRYRVALQLARIVGTWGG